MSLLAVLAASGSTVHVTPEPSVFGAHGWAAILLTAGIGTITLVAIFKTGIVPLFRAVARTVEAMEIIIGTEKKKGLQERLDEADADREKQREALEDIHRIVKAAGLLNGKGEAIVADIHELKSAHGAIKADVTELMDALRRHATDESARNAAIWAAILENRTGAPK